MLPFLAVRYRQQSGSLTAPTVRAKRTLIDKNPRNSLCFQVFSPISLSPRDHCHETHLPTRQAETRPYALFPRAHEDPWRPPGAERPSRQGPQASDPVIGESGLRLPRTARLLRPADFAALKQHGKRFTTRHFVIE